MISNSRSIKNRIVTVEFLNQKDEMQQQINSLNGKANDPLHANTNMRKKSLYLYMQIWKNVHT